MPEAVKEVVTEVSQGVLKENSPDKLPCKEVKPAEASSGTLPADEETKKDAGEGAVAPDLGQGEAPEQGKSEINEESKDALLDNKNDNEKETNKISTDDKSESEKSDSNTDDAVIKESPVDELKEINSDESISQETKQSSPEECKMEESKQASPEQSKTEVSMETQTPNEQISTANKVASENNPKKEGSENKETSQIEKTECIAKDQEDTKKSEYNQKDESMDTNTEENKKVHNAVEKQGSVTESTKYDSVKPVEDRMDSSTKEKETKVVLEENHEKNIETMETSNQDPKISENKSLAEYNESCNKSDKMEEVLNKQRSEAQMLQSESMPSTEEKMDEDKMNIATSQENFSSSGATNPSTKEIDSSEKSVTDNVTSDKKENADIKSDSSENSSVKAEGDATKTKKESEKQIDVSLTNGNADGSGSSKEVDIESAEEIKRQVREGKALLATGDYFTAADVLGKACEAAGKLYGDLANENADLYYLYGSAMLECAKNENNVLGEGVKEKEDEEEASEDTQDIEVNGDEQMETEENVDGEEEKMAVDSDETTKDKETTDNITVKEDSEQENTENGLDEENKTTKENSDEEEDSSLKVAWEMFELAKIAFTRMGNEERLADTYVKLAEVALESGNQSALDDMKAALELRKKSTTNLRLISETHFNLGLGFATFEMFDDAIEQFKLSKSLLEAKIDSLLKGEEGEAKDEIKDIKELLPDLDEKIQDMQESKETKLKHVQNGEISSVEKTEVSKPVSNITHLIKRKRKLEDVASDLLPNTKQPCTEKIVESEESKQ